MHHTRQVAGSPATQPHNHRLLNHAVAALLRSPLHGLISRDLMLITFTGRKSGRSYTTPVTYSQQGEQIVFHSTQRWWKNLEGSALVTLRLRGREQGLSGAQGVQLRRYDRPLARRPRPPSDRR
jgi:hypothetical protein